MTSKYLALTVLLIAIVSCGGSDDSESKDSDSSTKASISGLSPECTVVKSASDENIDPDLNVELTLVGTHVSENEFDSSSAEVVAFDSCTDQLFVVNAADKTVDVLKFGVNNSAPYKFTSLSLTAAEVTAGIDIGAANSVAAYHGAIAVAIEAETKQDDGIIALYRADTLEILATYPAGALPDMVTFSANGRYILSANEGEPSDDYADDPEGSVTIVDLNNGFTSDLASVKQVLFTEFNQGKSRASEVPSGVRLAGPEGTSVAEDLEPEYITLDQDETTAWVALQENNAFAIIDIENAQVSSLVGLGGKSWSSDSGNTLDASDEDQLPGSFSSYDQLEGLYMPDALASFEKDGEIFILSANEGDGREYTYVTNQETCEDEGHTWDSDDNTDTDDYSTEDGDCISFTDEARGADILDKVAAEHPLKAALDDVSQLERLKVVNDKDSYSATDTIYSFGARSFSIWNRLGGLVYDSGDDIADRVFNEFSSRFSDITFNASNDTNFIVYAGDKRSDDKGTEPEAIEVASFGDRSFAFVGLERQGGVMVFEITDPTEPSYQLYVNNRDFLENVCTQVDDFGYCVDGVYREEAGDLGPESIEYFSRLGKHFLAIANEVSGTVSVYEITFESKPIL